VSTAVPLNFSLGPIQAMLTQFGLRILAAIAIATLGLWGARVVRQAVRRMMGQRHLDVTLVAFAGNLAYVGIIAFSAIAALGQVGVDTASILTVLGAAGLAIGLALQGSLSNFAAGILLVLFRPFKVGDFIEGAGASGYVVEIQFLSTLVRTRQNKLAIIPNSELVEGKIINHSTEPYIRVDVTISVDGREGAKRVHRVLLEEVQRRPLVLADPPPTVGLMALGEGAMQFMVQAWVATPNHYWVVHFALNEAIKERFDREGIRLPEPPLTEMAEAIREALHDGPTNGAADEGDAKGDVGDDRPEPESGAALGAVANLGVGGDRVGSDPQGDGAGADAGAGAGDG